MTWALYCHDCYLFDMVNYFGINDPINGMFVNELVVESNKNLNESNMLMNIHKKKMQNNIWVIMFNQYSLEK